MTSASFDHPDIPAAAARVLERCDRLARHSEDENRLTRTFLSPAMAAAHREMQPWMQAAGLETSVDALGNLLGRTPPKSRDERVLMIGSHLDTVRDAGKYDGPLGVLLGIALAELLQSSGRDLTFGLEVIGFSEEEGVRFGVPYLGSHAIAGSFDPKLLLRRDAEGTTVSEAIKKFGLDPLAWRTARQAPETILAYLEAHIEQGPVLESLNEPLGVVSAIVGQSRFRLKFKGQPGHAGTLPMELRFDALTAAAEWITSVEKLGVRVAGAVATVGEVHVAPNAPNVVPGEVLCSLDVRHADDAARQELVAEILGTARRIAENRHLKLETEAVGDHAAVPMDPHLTELLRRSVGTTQPHTLVSGAGHDAAIMAHAVPAAMLFLRSPGGLSHNPLEAVIPSDVTAALAAMWRFVNLLEDESFTSTNLAV